MQGKRLQVLAAMSLIISLIFSGCSLVNPASRLSYADEINKTQIITFEISVDETSWQTMLDQAMDERYISANVKINGKTIENVGVRPKGNASLSMVQYDKTTDRYSFKIKFDEFVDGQTWLGLDKIIINNINSDPTYMKEYISYDIMDYTGVKEPLCSYANISVNGKPWGFYLAVEDIDKGYLNRAFKGEGKLYKPNNDDKGDMQNLDANGVSLQYGDDNVSSYSAIFSNAKTKTKNKDYQRVITALKNLNQGTDLEKYVDVDAVLKYFAAQTMVVNVDSYISNVGHNYYLYENNGQINILPWDYNLSFGAFLLSDASQVVNFPINTPVYGVNMEERPLLNKLLKVPEYLDKYHKYIQQINNGYFADGKFEQAINTTNNLISEYVKNDSSAFYTYDQYKKAVIELKKLGALRSESVKGQLDGTIPSTTEAQKKDSGKLIDASSIDFTSLGVIDTMGMDMKIIWKAMEIIGTPPSEKLTGEQRTKLHDLGLTDEQVEQIHKYVLIESK